MKRYLSVALCLLLFPVSSWALATTMELGVRGGTDASSLHESYTGAEVYYMYTLPWQKVIGSGMRIYTRLDAGLGYLEGDSETGGWIAVGGDVVLSVMEGRLEFEAGLRPTLLFEHEFGRDDFGGPVQFMSHAGATVNFDNFSLSYRYSHISNADIYDENSGIDLHLVGMGVRF